MEEGDDMVNPMSRLRHKHFLKRGTSEYKLISSKRSHMFSRKPITVRQKSVSSL